MKVKKLKPRQQRKKVVAVDRHWVDDAARDLTYNSRMESLEKHADNMVEAKFYAAEAAWDKRAVKKRQHDILDIVRGGI